MSASSPKLSSLLLRNIAAIGLARAGSIVLDGVAYVLVARYLGPTAYGGYISVLAFLVLIDLACDLTVTDITVREMSRDRPRLGIWLTGATVLRLALAMLGLCAFGGYLFWNRAAISAEAFETAWIAALILPVGALRVPLTTFRAGLKMEHELAVTLAARALNLACVLAIVRWEGSLAHLFLTLLLTRTVLGLLSWVFSYRLFRPRLGLDSAVIRRLVRESIPMAVSGLFVAAQLKVDLLLVSALAGPSAGGVYAVVAQLPEYFLYVPVVITTPVLPLLSKFFADSDRDRFQFMYQKLFDVLMALVLPVAIVASILPETVVKLLFGDAYLQSAGVLPILMASIVFMWYSHVTAIAAVATGLQRHFIWIQGICVLVYLGLDLVLIPRWGLAAAAWVRLAATVIAPVMTFAVVKRGAGFRLKGAVVLRIVVACGAMVSVIALLGSVSLSLSVFLGCAVYLMALWVTGAAPWTIPRQLEGRI